ncbi:hypothetical protein JXO59_08750 [candidate division KSB1 bacterium]|nr:hypothetical protein [candidate division KSB1 bacterium]
MINLRHKKRLGGYIGLFALTCGMLLCYSCKKEEKGGEIKPPPASIPESELQLSRIAGDLLSLQEQIRQNPQDLELRLQLLTLAVNQEQKSVRAVGIGKIPSESQNLTVASQGAERAAFIDGCRWIAYLLAWNKDHRTPDFGHIRGEVPPAKTLYKHTAPDQVVVMVEANLE